MLIWLEMSKQLYSFENFFLTKRDPLIKNMRITISISIIIRDYCFKFNIFSCVSFHFFLFFCLFQFFPLNYFLSSFYQKKNNTERNQHRHLCREKRLGDASYRIMTIAKKKRE